MRCAVLVLLLLSACTDSTGPRDIERWTEDGYQFARKDGVTCSLIRAFLNGQEILRQWVIHPRGGACPFNPDSEG